MTSKNRPLSPHVQIYRPQITSVLSITHRITGVGLAVGLLLLTYWLSSAAYGPEAYHKATAFLGSWFGQVLLFGWTVALFYHLTNGIRHLLWDTGRGLEIPQVYRSGRVVVASTVVLTVLAWAVGLSG
ncbi:MAG: succinate dehydrogenase, cytochrome b556 subunit [Alphaproteobacteria bacterium]|nr:succinate dehydrogenase, cytochrome b556 subunit [Alphaproteobacteria bacterium]